MRLKEIQSLTLRDLKSMDDKQLKSIQKSLMNIKRKRMATFEKHGVGDAIATYIQNVKSGRTRGEIINNINKLSNWTMRQSSTYKGYVKQEKDKRQAIEDALGRPFKDDKEFNEYIRFMNAMRDRANGMWDVQSMTGAELFDEAKRLNMNPVKLVENYDYWMSMVDKLKKKKKPVKRKGMTSSEYISTLRLPSIEKFYDKLEKDRMRHEKRRRGR